MTSLQIISLVIFAVTMALIMTEKLHRTAAALAGSVLLLITGVLTVSSRVSYVDINTIGVLVGMMLFVAVVKNSGIFEYIAIRAAKMAKGRPWAIMVSFIVITAVLSAFLDNVTTVLLIGPMTLAITNMLKVSPVPFFMTQIMASNIGGTATLIGDPPNIMIGSAAGLSFTDFVCNTGVAVVFVLIVTTICFYFIYGRKLHVHPEEMAAVMQLDETKAINDRPLLIKSVVMIVLIILAFIFHDKLGLESSVIALTAAAIMILIGRQDVEETVRGVEWSTILFFIGLFIVVGPSADRLRGRAHDADHPPAAVGVGHHLVLPGQHPLRRHADPPRPGPRPGRDGHRAALVGHLPRRVPRRQRHPDRRLGQRGPLRHQQPPRASDHLRQLSEGRLPAHARVRRHQHALPADQVRMNGAESFAFATGIW